MSKEHHRILFFRFRLFSSERFSVQLCPVFVFFLIPSLRLVAVLSTLAEGFRRSAKESSKKKSTKDEVHQKALSYWSALTSLT